jgi:antitoxin ParD1/3/4
MERGSVHFSLPLSMRHYVEERVEEGGYASASAYLRELIRREQREREREAQDALRALLAQQAERLERGETVQVTPEYWQAVRREAGRSELTG